MRSCWRQKQCSDNSIGIPSEGLAPGPVACQVARPRVGARGSVPQALGELQSADADLNLALKAAFLHRATPMSTRRFAASHRFSPCRRSACATLLEGIGWGPCSLPTLARTLPLRVSEKSLSSMWPRSAMARAKQIADEALGVFEGMSARSWPNSPRTGSARKLTRDGDDLLPRAQRSCLTFRGECLPRTRHSSLRSAATKRAG